MSGRQGDNDQLRAALVLLDEVGIADPSIGVTIAAAGAAAGVTRSTIYRRWDSAADLNADLAVIAVCHAPTWQHRLLQVPVETPFGEAVLQAHDGRTAELATTVRALAAGWPTGTPAKDRIAAWERAWLAALGEWLSRSAEARGLRLAPDATPAVAGVAVAATVEGWMSGRVLAGHSEGEEAAGPSAELGRRLQLLERQLLVPDLDGIRSSRRHEPIAQPVAPEVEPARLELGRRIVARWDEDLDQGRWPAEPSRMVDIERLARRLDVTSRGLYELWPSASDMNQALLRAWFDRERAAIADHAVAWLTAADPSRPMDLLLQLSDGLDEGIRRRVTTAQANQHSFTHAIVDPQVRAALATIHADLLLELRTVYLGMLSYSGSYRRAGLSADDYAAINLEASIGVDRLVALNPSLLDGTATFLGTPHTFCGAVLHQIAMSVTTTRRPTRPDPGDARPTG